MGKAILRELAIIASLIIAALLTVLLLSAGFDKVADTYEQHSHTTRTK